MIINVLGNRNTILDQYIAEMRDANVQGDPMRFRLNLERYGQLVAYELSKELAYKNEEIITPLGTASGPVLAEHPVIASILRAGLPLHNGLLAIFDKASNAFVSAYRKHTKDGSFDVMVDYISSPDIEGKVLILADAMLATGLSLFLCLRELLTHGKPRHIHIVSVLASVEGVEYIKRNLAGLQVTLWVGAIDDELTAQAYIVPGLGDAGDLAYGLKN